MMTTPIWFSSGLANRPSLGGRWASGRRGAAHLPGSLHLVKARAAIDWSVVARCKRHDRLAAARAADCGVELAWSTDHAGAFRGSPTGQTALRVVLQTFAEEKRLLPGGEDELLGTVAADERSVLVHPDPGPPAP